MTQSSISIKALESANDAIRRPVSYALARHIERERASFHTPGHKGVGGAYDLTELPGLDELSAPSGCIRQLEVNAAELWESRESIISVNGASAGIIAAILAVASRGKRIVVPVNAHRSAISGLVLSGLKPIWYEPNWDEQWGIWGSAEASAVEKALGFAEDIAAVVVVSPTYSGAMSDVRAIAEVCKRKGVPLICDEAHGAHLIPGSSMPAGALQQGADIVVHSLHKTLPSLTQTGIVHVGKESMVSGERVQQAMNMVQTSSPSYVMLVSIEETVAALLADKAVVDRAGSIAGQLREAITSSSLNLQKTGNIDPLHVLVRSKSASVEDLYYHLVENGVYPEAVLGHGVLLLIGTGTSDEHVLQLKNVLEKLDGQQERSLFDSDTVRYFRKPELPEQVMTPREAHFAQSESVKVDAAIGRIAAETIAPCPPGTAAVIAGQRVPSRILEFATIKKLKVVIE